MNKKPQNIHILLVNPWIIDFKAYDLWMKPLGLLYISSILKRNGYCVTTIDCMDRNHPSIKGKTKLRNYMTGKFISEEIEKPLPYKNIKRKYKRYGIPIKAFTNDLEKYSSPDIIMVTSTMTYWYKGAHQAISILKETFPQTPVILGGIYPTLCDDFAKKYSNADIIFQGTDMRELISLLGEMTKTEPSFIPRNFSDFPEPDFSGYNEINYGAIMTSAGCPFKCTYCASKKLYPEYIRKHPNSIVSEIKDMVSYYKIRDFAFYDDAIFVNKEKHIIPVLEELIKENLNLSFYSPNGLHAKFIDRKLAGLMKKSGFEIINLGLESGDPNIQKKTGDKVKNKELEDAIENLFKEGFSHENIRIFTLMGLTGQTFSEIDKTCDYIFSLKVQNRLSNFSPIPHTDAFNELIREKPFLEDPLYHNPTYHHYSGDWLTFEERKFLKDKCNRLNHKI